MPSVTRAEALTQARIDFQAYVERLVQANRLSAEYVSDLGHYWDRRLAALSRLGSNLLISPEVVSALSVLAREVRDRDLDDDAAVRWLDLFPDRVADLFPPSDVTFRLVEEDERREAAERISVIGGIASAA
jgi:hypothetical protein